MKDIILIAGMALVTLAVRYPPLALFGRITLPDPILRALKYVPPVVLTAIIVPAMLFRDNKLMIDIHNDYLVAGIVSGIVAWRSKNLLLTIIIGMGILILLRLVFGEL